ncbi:Hypothetical predicted protein [Olea europaea subsp. europaea]|uniref:Uncharacterized protein n=1 Tax=Olea europaea subsp. europaea TaxID=158383 RepID=A0A8S0V332_OLEEU|nr:Hypothetical predicted protein [Olea europaea subsp. europaea]
MPHVLDDMFDAPLAEVESQPTRKVLASGKLAASRRNHRSTSRTPVTSDPNILPTIGNKRRTEGLTETLEEMVDMLKEIDADESSQLQATRVYAQRCSNTILATSRNS